MNRNSIRAGYQHDISIIENLPERLKKKIADKAKGQQPPQVARNCPDEIVEAAVKTTAHVDASKQAVPCNTGTADEKPDSLNLVDEVGSKIPGILRLNGSKSENHLNKKQREQLKSRKNAAAAAGVSTGTVPGIIRLNANEQAQLAKTFGGAVGKKEDERSRTHLKVLRPKNDRALDALLPVSPARNFAAKKYPPWFGDSQIEAFANDLKQLFDTFTGLMQQNAVQQHWLYFNDTRQQLLLIFKEIVLQHLKFCCETKCDSFFWKLLFYNVRELLKFSNSTLTHEQLTQLFEEGITFYMDLIKNLKLKYLKSATATNAVAIASSQKPAKFEVIAKVVAQKLLINLGDLCRYKALHLKSNDLTEAGNFYREAQILLPTNGIPYNQLAIVAIHDRKKFEAIYLHMRSLMSSNAIQSAKESLLILLDEIRKKFEKTEPKISPLHQYKQTSSSNSQASSGSNSNKVISPLRKEVWIHPDGVRRLHRTNIDGRRGRLSKPAKNLEMRLDEMPNEELLHRFISIYLYMIGKLYTGIGMETIQTHQYKLLTQLSALLKKKTTPILLTRAKIMKIATLNIFILQHNIQQARREMRYYTFTFCNQIFGILLQKCNQILAANNDEASVQPPELEKRKGFKDLNTLLQFVNIYTRYLSLNVDIWEPIRKDDLLIDPWLELQNLFEHLENVDFVEETETEKEVILEEDQFTYGFTPLTTLQPKYFDANQACGSEVAQFLSRLKLLKAFSETYTEHAARLQNEETDEAANSSFVLEELDNDIKAALETLHKATAAEAVEENDVGEIDKTPTNEAQGNEAAAANAANVDAASTDNEQLAHLTKLKRELAQQTNAKRSYSAKLEEILSYVDTKVYIEVRPKYLMPDTNCFIDYLDDFERLIKNYKRYTLVIPLTVVRELDGLSKGIKADSRPHFMQKHRIHHFDDVSTCAKRSLDFIKNTKQQVKCVTSKGSIINASLFALVEEDYMSNDDRILATALALSKTMCLETSKDDKCFIQTQLVLITTDRNLRVKALSRNLAVSELDEFLLWARDCT